MSGGGGDSLAGGEASSTSGPASDLFSEIHLNELQKLEKKLEGSEFEKLQLDASLKESKDTLDKLTVCLASQVAHAGQLRDHVTNLRDLQKEITAQEVNLDRFSHLPIFLGFFLISWKCFIGERYPLPSDCKLFRV